MMDEERLLSELVPAEFEPIAPHNMSAKQQIEAFSSAAVIVGASGSAMFNVVFCHPGTRLIRIESEPHWIFAHLNLFGSCKLDFGVIEGQGARQGLEQSAQAFHREHRRSSGAGEGNLTGAGQHSRDVGLRLSQFD
jgi:Glycosyltransferase 61